MSLRGDDLLYANPVWVGRLAGGARLLASGWLVAMASLVITLPSRELGSLLAIASVPLMGFGSWLLTEPDPGRVGEPAYGRPRTLARWFCLAGSFLPAAVFTNHYLKPWFPAAAGLMGWVLRLSGLSALAGVVLLLGYLKSFVGRRMPDGAEEDFLSFTHRLVSMAGAVLVAGLVIKWVDPRGGVGAVLAIGFVAAPLLALLIGCVCSVQAVWNVGRALRLRAAMAADSRRGRAGGGSAIPGPVVTVSAKSDNPGSGLHV